MSKLRPLHSEDVLRALKRAGFEMIRRRGEPCATQASGWRCGNCAYAQRDWTWALTQDNPRRRALRG